MPYFSAAPWSTLLKAISAFTASVLLVVGYVAWRVAPPAGLAHSVGTLVAWVPPAIAIGAALFLVAGYEVDGGHLRIKRLLWTTTFRLEGLRRIWEDPDVIKGSIRVFGNGGLFSFSGVFWSRRLGRYRLYATDLKRCVVLVLADRVVVLSPADPSAFVAHARELFPNVQGREA